MKMIKNIHRPQPGVRLLLHVPRSISTCIIPGHPSTNSESSESSHDINNSRHLTGIHHSIYLLSSSSSSSSVHVLQRKRNKLQSQSFPFPSTFISQKVHLPHSQFSTSSATNSKNPTKEIKLKQLIRPFLLTYHPDRLQNTTNITKQENLKAIQTLNGMIDTIDHIYNRAMDSSSIDDATSTTSSPRMELQSKYTIEFLVPSNNDTSNNPTTTTKKQKEAISTRRSVDLNFTSKERNIVQSIDGKKGTYSKTAAKIVKIKAMKEISKLLRVAGLEVPDFYDEVIDGAEFDLKQDVIHRRELLDIHDQMILDELDLGEDVFGDNVGGGGNNRFDYSSSSRFEKRREPKTEYEKSRERYMKKVDWKKHA